MATYVNDLRLKEISTGDESGTWGTSTNTNLELIGEALGYATQQVFGSDADATTTIADGASDPARAMYFKITSAGSLTATRTCTIAPNTVSRVMFIENATSGSQSIAISQGSGASVTIATGKTAVVYLDGAGATAAVVDAMSGVDPGVTDTLTEVLVAGNTSGGTNIELSTTDKVQFRDADIYINSSVDGQLDIVADTEIQIAATTIDIDGTIVATTSTDQAFPLTVTNSDADSNTYIKYLDQGGQYWTTGINYASNDFVMAYGGTNVAVFANAGGLTVTSADNLPQLTLVSTDADALVGPQLNLWRNSGSAANGDLIGQITFTGEDSLSNTITYASIHGVADQVDNGAEDGSIRFSTRFNDVLAEMLAIGSSTNGVTINDTGIDADFRVESDGNAYMFYIDAGTDTAYFGGSDNRGFINIEKEPPLASNGAFTSPHIALQALNQPTDNDGFVGMSFALSDADNYGFTVGAQRTTGGVGNLVFRNHFNDANGTEMMAIKGSSGIVFNEDGNDQDFRVESDTNANGLMLDASTSTVGVNRAASAGVGLSVNATATNSSTYVLEACNSSSNTKFIVRSDGYSGFYKSSNAGGFIHNTDGAITITPDAGGHFVFNEDGIDADFRVESDDNANMLFVDGGNNRVGIGKAPASQPFEVGVFSVFDTGMTINETGVDADFRVESDNNAYMFYVDAGLDAIGIGAVLGSGYQATQQGMMQFKNGGSEGTPVDGGIEFYAAQAGDGYSHRLCAFDNSAGDTPLLLQRRNNSTTWSTQITFEGNSNNVVFAGTVSKGGGSFKIDHPLPSMNGTHHLVHSFVEGPQADNLYRGRVTLVDGQASVNLDTTSNMTEGTFVLLNRDVQCFTSNETGWTAVRGTVSGNTISIEAQDNTCTDTISWMVVGERHDQFMYDNEFADDDGHIIVEPIKKPHLQNT
jgi:hypothetical protein